MHLQVQAIATQMPVKGQTQVMLHIACKTLQVRVVVFGKMEGTGQGALENTCTVQLCPTALIGKVVLILYNVNKLSTLDSRELDFR